MCVHLYDFLDITYSGDCSCCCCFCCGLHLFSESFRQSDIWAIKQCIIVNKQASKQANKQATTTTTTSAIAVATLAIALAVVSWCRGKYNANIAAAHWQPAILNIIARMNFHSEAATKVESAAERH